MAEQQDGQNIPVEDSLPPASGAMEMEKSQVIGLDSLLRLRQVDRLECEGSRRRRLWRQWHLQEEKGQGEVLLVKAVVPREEEVQEKGKMAIVVVVETPPPQMRTLRQLQRRMEN